MRFWKVYLKDNLKRGKIVSTLSPLQKEFLDVLMSDSDIVQCYTQEEEFELLYADLRRMNAAELRQNIKVFKETACERS